jgi:hypothetical protein
VGSQRIGSRTFFLVLTFLIAATLVLPATALGQPAPGQATATPGLTLSATEGQSGASVTANGSGFRAVETVRVTFNGQPIGTPTTNTGGTWSLAFTVPNIEMGEYVVGATGESSATTASAAFEVNQGVAALTFSVEEAAPGVNFTIMGTGFRAGEIVRVTFNGAELSRPTADTAGKFSVTAAVPTLAAGEYVIEADGQTSNVNAHENFTVLAGPAPAPTTVPEPQPQPTATPAPAPQPVPVPATAPALAHDDRYYGQTGYRIENDQVWGFFQSNGGTSAFGYPVSRTMTFLGCPVQMFQRHIIQVCPNQGAGLINLLDPEIFPYTQVNGSVLPAPDNNMKANTPPVSDPDYSAKISAFVQANVPDTFSGQSVNFFQTFNSLGGLQIWGAPISSPQPDPSNGNFIYQRFQRGVMHFTSPSTTESILLADYLKAIIMNQNVPTDLMNQSRESRYFNQYCPGATNWLCRPNDLPGTDLTFAFVQG